MADKKLKIEISTPSDTTGAKAAVDAIDDVKDSTKALGDEHIRIVDTSKKSTDGIDENKRALKEWQEQRDAARRGAGSSLATDPAELYAEEARALQKVADAEREVARAKEAAVAASEAKKEADNAAREAVRKLKEETQAADQVLAGKRRTLNALATAANAAGGRLGAVGTVLRSLVNPYALIGTAVGLVTAKVISYTKETLSAASAARQLAKDSETKWEDEKTKRIMALSAGFRDLDKARAAIWTTSLAATYAAEDEQLRLQSEAIEHNIDMHKRRIDAMGGLDRITTQTEIDRTDSDAQRGAITESQAAARRAALEEGLRNREIQRLQELSLMDDALAATSLATKQQELRNAEARFAAARAQEADLEAQREALQNEMALRTKLDQARNVATTAREELSKEHWAAVTDYIEEDMRTLANAAALRKRAEAERAGAGSAPGAAARAEFSAERFERQADLIETLLTAQARAEELAAEENPRGEMQISRERGLLLEEIKKVAEAVAAAKAELEQRTTQLTAAEQTTSQQMERERQARAGAATTNTAEVASAELTEIQERLRIAGEQSAEKLGTALEQIIADMGEAAETPGVQGVIARVRELIADGIQSSEESETVALLGQLVQRMSTQGASTAQLFQQMMAEVEKSISLQTSFSSRIDEIARSVQTLQSQQGNKNF